MSGLDDLRKKLDGANEAQAATRAGAMQSLRQKLGMRKLESDETGFLDQAFLEDQVGGRVRKDREIDSFGLKRALGKRETADQALAYLRNNPGELPEGAIPIAMKTRNGGYEMAYRMPGETDVNLINNPDEISLGDYGYASSDVISSESFLGGAAELVNPVNKLRLAGKIIRPAARALWSGLGSAIGRGIDEFSEGVGEGDLRSPESLLADMGESLAWGAAGQQLGEGAERVNNLRKGKGAGLGDDVATGAALNEQQGEFVKAANKYGLRPSMGDAGDASFQRVEMQDQALNASHDWEAKQKYVTMAEDLGAEAGPYGELDDAVLLDTLQKEREKLKAGIADRLGARTNPRPILMDGAAEGIPATMRKMGADVAEYKRLTSAKAGRDFASISQLARDEGIGFDLSETLEIVEEATDPMRLAGREQTIEPSFLDREVGIGPRTTREEVPIKQEYAPELQSIMEQLKKVDSIQGPERFDTLRLLERKLARLGDSPNLAGTESQSKAQDLRHSILRAYDNASGSEQFTALLKQRKAEWADRTRNLKTVDFLRNVEDTGGGTKAYDALRSMEWSPEHYSVLRKMLPKERMDEFRQAMYSDMLERPENIDTILKNIPDLRMIPKTQRDILRQYQVALSKQNTGAINATLMSNMDTADKIRKLITDGSDQDISAIIGNALSPADAQHATFQIILEDSTDYIQGQVRVDPAKLRTAIEWARKSGIMKHLTDSQKELLTDYDFISSFLAQAKSSGGDSLVAAGVASQMFTPISSPIKAGKAVAHRAQIGWAARLSRNGTLVNATKGAAGLPKSTPELRAIVLGATITARRASERQTLEREPQN